MMSLSDKDDDAAAQPHLHRIAQRRKKNAQKQNKILKKENKRRKTYVPQETPRSLCFELLTCFCGGSRKNKKKKTKPNKNEKEEENILLLATTERERDWCTNCLTADAQYTEKEGSTSLGVPFFFRLLTKSSFSWRLCSVGTGSLPFFFLSLVRFYFPIVVIYSLKNKILKTRR